MLPQLFGLCKIFMPWQHNCDISADTIDGAFSCSQDIASCALALTSLWQQWQMRSSAEAKGENTFTLDACIACQLCIILFVSGGIQHCKSPKYKEAGQAMLPAEEDT